MSSDIIILDVSGRKFRTRKSALRESLFFRNMLDNWESLSDQQEDGSHFIDADPDMFQHVLDFIRRPTRFPLFWTKEKGFDYVLYNKLEAEADYFRLQDLYAWVRNKRYRDAVKTVVEVKRLSEALDEYCWQSIGSDPEMKIQTLIKYQHGGKRYICPMTTHAHEPRHCLNDTSCKRIVEAHGQQYSDPSERVAVITQRIVFDRTVCDNKGQC